MEKESVLFTPGKIGPLTLRNRTIRAAAFESMCPGNAPSDMLYDYHKSVAVGGIGMTTLAYAAVTQSGLSFERQLWMRPDIIPGLKRITDAIHKEGAAASVQLGHCGNMSHKNICGCRPISASGGFNIYSPTLVRGMKPSEITAMAKAFGQAVHLAREAGMDAVEIHAGHGYLISQFLSPYTNHRKDEYGGSLHNRMRFMKMCMDEVMKAAGQDMAVLVKMNMRDGFKGGMELDETLEVARTLQDECGAHALILSGGFVSRAPMYVMRGSMPIHTMTHYMPFGWLPLGVKMAGRFMIPSEPFKEAYFLEDALKFRAALKMPLVYVGGLTSREKIDEVLNDGFEFVSMARALLNDPSFVNKMKEDEHARCDCGHSNYCIARMYSIEMACHKHIQNLPKSIIKEIEKLKSVTRFNRTLDGRFENSAEHSWQGAIAAMVLQDYYPEKLNMEKVISMLLIHDLGEIYAGDTWVFDDKNKVHSHDRELQSIEKTMSILPEEKYLNMKNSWLEFEKGQSAEARYARVIDALVPLINHLEVSELNYNPDNISSDMVLEKKKFIKDESKELWKLTEELVKESVEKGLYL